jgi:hypothetical protein
MSSDSIIPRTTLSQLVAAYRQSDLDIRQAFALLAAAEQRLKEAFGGDYSFRLAREMERRHLDFADTEKLLGEVKKDAWRALVARMELRRILSVAATKQLDSQLETGKDLPEIEENAILAMLDGTLARTNEFLEEAVKEVFEYLRPHRSGYKTNSELEIGSRVILGWAVEPAYHSPRFHVNHHREANLRGLDNVFHALDGKGTIKSHRGPLVDAIQASPDGRGETDYFKFRCYANSNLHLEFKRPELVQQLNRIAGGNRLRPPGPGAPPFAEAATCSEPIAEPPAQPSTR